MRFLAAPWVGMLEDEVWLKHARNANEMARRLADGVSKIPGAKLMFPREANAVFVVLPPTVIRAMHERGWKFYTFIGEGGCRFMCSWDTTEADVTAFLADLTECRA